MIEADSVPLAEGRTHLLLVRMDGVPHAWCNLSDSPLRMVVIASPGGIEEILQLIAKGGDIDIMALSEKFGVRNIGHMLSPSLCTSFEVHKKI